MSGASLERVQQDLEIVRSALPSDSPHDRRSVAISALAAICGIPFALRAVPGWDSAMSLVLLAGLGALGVLSATWWSRAQSERGSRPRRWSFAREEIAFGSIVAAALIVYAVLKRSLAQGEDGWNFRTWREELAGPVLFSFGVCFVAWGVMRRDRRSFLGWGLSMLGLGLAMPWIDSRAAFWAVGGIAISLGGIVSTTVMWCQLRAWEGAHVRN